jgi:DNA-binding NarL/FixJ family response regulator
MNILISLASNILSHALKEFLEKRSDEYHINTLWDNKNLLKNFKPEIILSDLSNLSYKWDLKYIEAKIVIIDTGLKDDEIINAFLNYNIHGVIPSDTDILLFTKLLNKICEGEIVANNDIVQSLLEKMKQINVPGKPTKNDLSNREKEISKLVCNGFTNKEIGQKLFVSEQTVKHHINKIFVKLNLSTRYQLMSRVMNDNMNEL